MFVLERNAIRHIGIIDRQRLGDVPNYGVRICYSQKQVRVLRPQLSDAKQPRLLQHLLLNEGSTCANAHVGMHVQIVGEVAPVTQGAGILRGANAMLCPPPPYGLM